MLVAALVEPVGDAADDGEEDEGAIAEEHEEEHHFVVGGSNEIGRFWVVSKVVGLGLASGAKNGAEIAADLGGFAVGGAVNGVVECNFAGADAACAVVVGEGADDNGRFDSLSLQLLALQPISGGADMDVYGEQEGRSQQHKSQGLFGT